MNGLKIIKDVIPGPVVLAREVIIVLVGVLGAALIISRFPALKKLVTDSSITVKDDKGDVLY